MKNVSQFDNICTGCGLCSVICPSKHITMKQDEYGFYKPSIDSDCNGCGYCIKKCPLNNRNSSKNIQSYCGANINEKERLASSSGGIFSIICKYILDQSGVVYGVSFDENLTAKTIRVDDVSDFDGLRKAKYVQAVSWQQYENVKRDLENGLAVVYSGTPCQIAGLQNFLGTDYEQLFLVEVACHGVPSNGLFQSYIEESEKKLNKKITNVSFRDKSTSDGAYSWENYFVTFYSDNKIIKTEYFRKNDYMKAFFNDLSINNACFHCRYKVSQSLADLTIGDFWGVDDIAPALNDDKGLSIIICHSKKGKCLIDMIKTHSFNFKQISNADAFKHNKYLITHPKPNLKYNNFMKNYKNNIPLGENLNKCLYPTIIKKIKKLINERIRGKY